MNMGNCKDNGHDRTHRIGKSFASGALALVVAGSMVAPAPLTAPQGQQGAIGGMGIEQAYAKTTSKAKPAKAKSKAKSKAKTASKASKAATSTRYLKLFDDDGVTLLKTLTSKTSHGNAKFKLPNIKRSGYVLQGWRFPDSGYVYSPGSMVSRTNSQCVAVWEHTGSQRIFVKFVLNGGRLKTPGSTSRRLTPVDGKATVSLPWATRRGYDFVGWENDGKTYGVGDKVEVTTNTAFKAVWERGVDHWRIDFDANGGKFSSSNPGPSFGDGVRTNRTRVSSQTISVDITTKSYSISMTMPEGPTKAGSTFAGWKANGKTYQPGEAVSVNSKSRFSAAWRTSSQSTRAGKKQQAIEATVKNPTVSYNMLQKTSQRTSVIVTGAKGTVRVKPVSTHGYASVSGLRNLVFRKGAPAGVYRFSVQAAATGGYAVSNVVYVDVQVK